MKNIFSILFLVGIATFMLPSIAFAQPNRVKHQNRLGDSLILKDVSEKALFQKRAPYRKSDFGIGPMLSSDGYGLIVSYGRAFNLDEAGRGNEEKYYNTHVLQLEISERLHPKEYTPFNYSTILGLVTFQNNGSFKYGKVNTVYNVKLSYLQRRLFGGRGEKGSPLVQFFGGGGFSMAMVKPYYIIPIGGEYIKYDTAVQNGFLNVVGIQGKAPFAHGIGESDFLFGVNLKAGIHLDFAKKQKRVSAIEVGTSVDFYFSPIAQMALIDSKSAFFNVFINYQFGKRW